MVNYMAQATAYANEAANYQKLRQWINLIF